MEYREPAEAVPDQVVIPAPIEPPSASVLPAVPPPPRAARTLTWLVAILAAALIALPGLKWWRTEGPAPALTVLPLVAYPGDQDNVTFSPDGKMVSFI